MNRKLTIIFLALLLASSLVIAADSDVRIKDIARFQGFTDNQLVGYGLVFGLNGTGDGNQIRFTSQAIANMLNAQGIRHSASQIRTRNVASVLVTATLPPFSKAGGKIDIHVSAIGDANSLQGGTLLLTQLFAPNGQVFATAQGQVVVGGFSAGGGGNSVTRNIPTAGMVPNGAIVQREVKITLQGKRTLKLVLDQYDFTTASRIATRINDTFKREIARSNDGGSVDIVVPVTHQGKIIDFIASVEGLTVETDEKAMVIINEKTGTVVIGKNVKMSSVAVAHGNLTISVSTQFLVSQPKPFTDGGDTVVVPDSEVRVDEGDGNKENTVMMLPEGTNIGEVVTALNALGVTPRDIISILQAMKAQGALKAELKVI